MPIVAHSSLPTYADLRARGEHILDLDEALKQDIRALHVGLLNMMPDAALQATLDHVDRWRPDLVVVNGDVVNRGPRSLDCWALLSERQGAEGWLIVGGNHEEYVGKWLEEPADEDDPRFPIYRSSYITFQQLGKRANEIVELPNQLELIGPEESTVRLTHGTMLGKDDGIAPDAPEAVLKRQISPAPDLFCTGHTHRPFVRQVNGTMVVNSGSAGTTFDGDPRSVTEMDALVAYLQILGRLTDVAHAPDDVAGAIE